MGLGKGIALAAAAIAAAGCTTVRVAQRDGCWVRETRRVPGGTRQEIGPCARPLPEWSDDRLTRLVQECVAQADHRWHARALAAWNRGEPPPAQDARESVVEACLDGSAAAAVSDNETLRRRLDEVSRDRESYRADASAGTEHLRESAARMAEYLGEAAKRPPPVATATATSSSDGTALTENGLRSETGASTGMPAAVTPPSAPGPVVPATAGSAPPSDGAPPAPPPPADARAKPEAKREEARRRKADASRAARERALTRAALREGCEIAPADAERPEALVCPVPRRILPEWGRAP